MNVKSMIVFGYDDWHALYVNGELIEQNHRIRIYDLVQASQGCPFFLEEREADASWWELTAESGAEICPKNFNDIPQEAFA